ncbi:flavin reductase family protein [Glaciimonas soli]|uniref:Flavin reductase n=1 Tax=Glaciimonas soli TaxID=2590999 RepID=A0A843YKY2_9BURK|nr:flavin reductase family protein [Glaciimonas soli]MQQ99599.1 flavin reductase [Glaciimonas soli]
MKSNNCTSVGDQAATATADLFRSAMRHMAGAVCVVTVGKGEDRSGLTATSVVSLSVDPPSLMVCVNRDSSSWPLLSRYPHFGVSVLAPNQRYLADQFAGKGGMTGAARYAKGDWVTLATGALVLKDAQIAFDCSVDEMIDRNTHSIVIGRVQAVIAAPEPDDALVYWRGRYGTVQPC